MILGTSIMLIALFAGESASWWARVEPYLNYPGFEGWKFLNLAVFVVIMVYILTRKVNLGDAFRARRESIKQELERARQERDAALAKLKEVEERFGRLDAEVATIEEQTKREAAEERERIAQATENEVAKLSEQAQREIERAAKIAKKDLRRYTAEQSVRLAEDLIRREMKPEDDARLIARNIEDLGGAAQ
jgi:F0F1-type ATP synthase membrane subunit b/b'